MTKFSNPFIPAFDLVVTRHAGLAAWLLAEGHIEASTPIVEHAHADRHRAEVTISGCEFYVLVGRRILPGLTFTRQEDAEAAAASHNAANIRGKHVVGVLPHHLSSLAASVTEVQLDIPRDFRGVELTPEQTGEFARGLHTYVVRRQDAAHQHSSAVEAAWRYVEDQGVSFGAGPGILTYLSRSWLGHEITVIGSGDEQASAEIIITRGLWRPMCRGPWLDGLGREVDVVEPAAGWDALSRRSGQVRLHHPDLKRSHDKPNNHSMSNSPEFEKAIFSAYAFVGWVWTCTFHGQTIVGPGDRSSGPVCPAEFLWLGDTALGWRWDAALRKGWSMLDDDARVFATEHLLPLCTDHMRGMLLGTVQSKG